MEEEQPKQAQVLLTEENTAAAREVAREDDRSVNNVVNRVLADAFFKRAVKSLQTKAKR